MNDVDEARAVVQARLDDHGYLSWLDTQVDDVERGAVALRIPFDERLTNEGPGTRGGVHGGIAATLIDTAGGVALSTTLADPVHDGVATVDLSVSYLRAAVGDLVADAEVVRTGRSIGVARAVVRSETPAGEVDAVAVGRGTYRLFPAADQ